MLHNLFCNWPILYVNKLVLVVQTVLAFTFIIFINVFIYPSNVGNVNHFSFSKVILLCNVYMFLYCKQLNFFCCCENMNYKKWWWIKIVLFPYHGLCFMILFVFLGKVWYIPLDLTQLPFSISLLFQVAQNILFLFLYFNFDYVQSNITLKYIMNLGPT